MILAFIWMAAALALSVTVRVDNELIRRGSVNRDGDSWVFVPSASADLPSSGLACVGIEQTSGFECQHVFKLQDTPREKYSIIVDSQDHVRVSAMPGELAGEVSSAQTISRPTPKQPQTIAAGQMPEETPVKEKSFLLKYWYLIPIAFVLLNAGGGKAQQ